jgi:hypothetical protein
MPACVDKNLNLKESPILSRESKYAKKTSKLVAKEGPVVGILHCLIIEAK